MEEIKGVPAEEKPSAADKFDLSGIRKKRVSHLDSPVWRLSLVVFGGCSIAWVLKLIFGFRSAPAVWAVALTALAAWIFAVRLILLESKRKTFWIIWLLTGVVLLGVFSTQNWIAGSAAFFSFIFLLCRQYKFYRHLSSKRMTAVFLLGLLVFGLITIGFVGSSRKFRPQASATAAAGQSADAKEKADAHTGTVLPVARPFSLQGMTSIGLNVVSYALISLRWFLFFSLFHLFISVRLSFMKLRPKLAVSAVLIAGVPVVLIFIMAALTLYSTLGGSRAARAVAILNDWADMAGRNEEFLKTLGRTVEVWEAGKTEGSSQPDWVSAFAEISKTGIVPKGVILSPRDAFYFWIGNDIWLIRVSGRGTPDIRIAGTPMSETMLDRLASILRSNVRLSFSNPIFTELSENLPIRVVKAKGPDAVSALRGVYVSEDRTGAVTAASSNSFWRKPLYFGMSQLDVLGYRAGSFSNERILLLLETRLDNLFGEFQLKNNPLGGLVVSLLIVLAAMMLIFEILTFIFGLRITGGIVSAVKELHRGTKRLADGDLETMIDIPNEDELGDLAGSFNAMAAAVKLGREEAVAREHLERELDTARKIQERLLPHAMPQVTGFEIVGSSLPSQQVGGDYFDFLDMASGRLGIAIADVSGKGISAALLMSNLQAGLHAQVYHGDDVSEVASRLNDLLVRSTDAHMFATFFFGVLDRAKAEFNYVNSGHNPPILLRANGGVERLGPGGLMLGFLPDQRYLQKTVTLGAGDLMVLYTDGITEAVTPAAGTSHANIFGEERLISVMRGRQKATASEIQAGILRAISDFTANQPQNDDITLVVIKRCEQPEHLVPAKI